MKIKRGVTAFLASAIAMTTMSVLSIDASVDINTEGTKAQISVLGIGDSKGDEGEIIDIIGTGEYAISIPVNFSSSELQDEDWYITIQTNVKVDEYDFEIGIQNIYFDNEEITYKGSSDDAFMPEDGIFRYNIYKKDVEFDIADSSFTKITVNFDVTKFEAKDGTTTTETSQTEDTTETSDTTDTTITEATSSTEETSPTEETSDTTDASGTESTSSTEETSATDASSSNSESTSSTTRPSGSTKPTSTTTTARTTSSTPKTTTAASTTQATANTTATADTTPPTGVTGVAGLVALAGIATGIAGFSRKK